MHKPRGKLWGTHGGSLVVCYLERQENLPTLLSCQSRDFLIRESSCIASHRTASHRITCIPKSGRQRYPIKELYRSVATAMTHRHTHMDARLTFRHGCLLAPHSSPPIGALAKFPIAVGVSHRLTSTERVGLDGWLIGQRRRRRRRPRTVGWTDKHEHTALSNPASSGGVLIRGLLSFSLGRFRCLPPGEWTAGGILEH